MSASGAGGPRIRELFSRAANAGSLRNIIFQGIGAVFFAVGTALASGILTIADVIIVPVSTLTNSVGEVITAIFGGAADIIGIGALSTSVSIAPGARFDLGPFTFALAVGALLLGLYLLNAYLSLERTGNLAAGLPFDLPTPGFDGPEEDNEDNG